MRAIWITLLTLLTPSLLRAIDFGAPPVTCVTNDFHRGNGVEVACYWKCTNEAPNTRWFRQVTTDGGLTWDYPEVLGTRTAYIDPDTHQLVLTCDFFFFMPLGVEFNTRPVPMDNFVLPDETKAWTLRFPDGGQTVLEPPGGWTNLNPPKKLKKDK